MRVNMRKLTQRIVMISIGTIAVFGIVEAFSLRSLIPIISNNIATIANPARYVQVGEEMTYSVSHEEAEPTVQEVLNGLQIEVPDGEGLTLNVKAYKDTEDHWSMTGNVTQSIQPDSVLGLVGRWKADALSGTYDSGDYVDTRADMAGRSYLQFDGNDDYVDVGDIDHSLTTLSVFAWVNTTGSNQYIFAHYNFGTPNQRSWHFSVSDNGKLRSVLSDDGTYIAGHRKEYETTTAINDGERHHVGFTWSGGDYILYVDGQEATVTKTYDDSFTTLHDSTAAVTIGTVLMNDVYNQGLDGMIYGAGIWDKALSSGDISDLYAGTIPTNDLVAYRPMNEGTGDISQDTIGSGYDGTITGDAVRTLGQGGGNDLSGPTTGIQNATVYKQGNIYGVNPFFTAGEFGDNGNKFYRYGQNILLEYDLSIPYDPETISFNQSIDISMLVGTTHLGIDFSASGDKLYVVHSNPDAVYELDMSVPWDISTLSYSGVLLSTTSEELSPYGFTMKYDGTVLYLIGSNSTIFQYNLSTPRDLNTASYSGEHYDFSTVFTSPDDIIFYDSGNKLAILRQWNIGPELYLFTLTGAYDLSTVSYANHMLDLYGDDSRMGFIDYIDATDQFFAAGQVYRQLYEYKIDRRPVYRMNIQNNLPGVYFDGTNLLRLSNALNIGTGHTIISVRQPEDNSDTNTILLQGSGFNILSRQNGTDTVRYNPFSSTYVTTTPTEPANDIMISAIQREGTNIRYYDSNHISDHPNGWTIVGTGETILESISPTNDNLYEGYVYEVLIYDEVLSVHDIGDITRYLANKRGLEN